MGDHWLGRIGVNGNMHLVSILPWILRSLGCALCAMTKPFLHILKTYNTYLSCPTAKAGGVC